MATARSQNSWTANDRSVIASYQLPGGRVALRTGDVSVVLLWVANRFHETVEPLRWPGVWGFAERTIRGSTTTLSNHASGTAIDLNAPTHPLARRGTFSRAQVVAIRNIVDYCEGVIRWGGDYTTRADEQHFEVNAGAAAVARIADKIRRGVSPAANPVSKPTPSPVPDPEDEMSQQQVDQLRSDIGHARDQILTRLGVNNPPNAPSKLPPEQLAGIDPARRVDVGYARDQLVAELASQRALLEAIAEKVGLTPNPPGGQS